MIVNFSLKHSDQMFGDPTKVSELPEGVWAKMTTCNMIITRQGCRGFHRNSTGTAVNTWNVSDYFSFYEPFPKGTVISFTQDSLP